MLQTPQCRQSYILRRLAFEKLYPTIYSTTSLNIEHQHSILWGEPYTKLFLFKNKSSVVLRRKHWIPQIIVFSVPRSTLIARGTNLNCDANIFGLLLHDATLNQRIFMLSPSMRPWIENPYGLILSFPSIWQI